MLPPRLPALAFLANPNTRLACLLGVLLVAIVVIVAFVQLIVGLMMWVLPVAVVVGGVWAFLRRKAGPPPA